METGKVKFVQRARKAHRMLFGTMMGATDDELVEEFFAALKGAGKSPRANLRLLGAIHDLTYLGNLYREDGGLVYRYNHSLREPAPTWTHSPKVMEAILTLIELVRLTNQVDLWGGNSGAVALTGWKPVARNDIHAKVRVVLFRNVIPDVTKIMGMRPHHFCKESRLVVALLELIGEVVHPNDFAGVEKTVHEFLVTCARRMSSANPYTHWREPLGKAMARRKMYNELVMNQLREAIPHLFEDLAKLAVGKDDQKSSPPKIDEANMNAQKIEQLLLKAVRADNGAQAVPIGDCLKVLVQLNCVAAA